MAARLGTPEGRAVYKQRKAIIEPVFAQLFARFGRTLNYRGDMVTTEIHLWAAVHNTLRPSAPAPAASSANARPPPGSPPWQPHSRPPDRPDHAKPRPGLTTARRTGPAAATRPG